MYQIEKSIPIPPAAGRTSQYPYALMEVGDSFFVPRTKEKSVGVSTSHARNKFPGRKFATRRVDNGVRVWRVA